MTTPTPDPAEAPSRTALRMAREIYKAQGNDPALAFIVGMTAAAITGHMIERTREQMHEALDNVMDAALAIRIGVTGTKQ